MDIGARFATLLVLLVLWFVAYLIVKRIETLEVRLKKLEDKDVAV